MKLQHIFFDLDHTLWDFEKNSNLTFQKVFKTNDISINLESFLEVYKPINLHYWKLFREEKVTKSTLRYGRLKKTFDQLRHTVSDELIEKIAVDYLNFLSEFNHLFEGTLEVLDYLSNKYKLHIITNGFDVVQNKKLHNSKILPYFDQIITSESVGVKKPNPKIFMFALALANAKKEHSIMIGDNLEADIQGALNIGMQAIHCNFEKKTVALNGFTSITSLLELKQYL